MKVISVLIIFIVTLLPLLLTVAFYTLSERKIMSIIQRRWGPDYVGIFGVFQPIADAIKLLSKDIKYPIKINKNIYIIAPILGLICALSNIIIMKFSYTSSLILDFKFSGVFRRIIMSLSSYSVIFGGWASNSKYSLLGSIRAISQRIAFEIFRILIRSILFRIAGSLSITDIALLQKNTVPMFLILPFISIRFFISNLMETNRIPFDLSEAEAELVAGYNVEYGGVFFLMYFLSEYLNMLFISRINVIFFYNAYNGIYFRSISFNSIYFFIKIVIMAQLLILLRALLPRYRYDHRVLIGWKTVLPFLLLILPLLIILTKLSWF